jgi:antirestriction protein ArdC
MQGTTSSTRRRSSKRSPARTSCGSAAPSKRREAAEQALRDVLELFETGSLPEKIAQTVIARQAGDSPSTSWSLGNQLLCLLAGTTDARGFRQWQAVDRHVTKGSRAFYILAPLARKIRGEDESGEETERTICTGFVGVPVFRLEDTEGAELPAVDYKPATFPPLFDVAERLSVRVSYLPFVDRYMGYYQPSKGSIVLCSHDVEVFFHELAHAAHDRISKLKGGQNPAQEIVAETVAATLCRLYGHDGYLWHGAEYVKSYAKGQNPGRAALRLLSEVQAVLDLILDHTSEQTPAEAPAELVTA